ncbi:MAG TPA: hypothetical protein VKV21_16585 [Solirubrobacteraceae bacterium]|nr:hypothetical protein [Solirubrobacteraceae bacterium]
MTALCEGVDPSLLAERIGADGAAELKRRATDAVNERLRPIWTRRAELIGDRTSLRRSRATSALRVRSHERTLAVVGEALHTLS